MFSDALSEGSSPIHRLDARVRIAVALGFSLVLAAGASVFVAGFGLAIALALCLVARLPMASVAKRLIPLNAFMLVLLVFLPFSASGTPLLHLGRFDYSSDGLLLAGAITLRGNAIVLALTALMGTIEVVHLGYALEELHVPLKLTRMFLFTVRYIDVLSQEYTRLTRAMTVRGFRPRLDRHTLRTLGYLTGMLIVRAFDRSERILAAMKCRGFSGTFPVAHPPRLGRSDVAFALGSATTLFFLLGCSLWLTH